jgi:hypothetical protein
MKNLFIVGAAAAFLAAGVTGSANAANPNVPASSPYALMNVDPYKNADHGFGYERRLDSGMVEGRAAYVDHLSIVPSHRHRASRGDDIIVHGRRSYLDPGTSADVGTENRYFYDTAHFDLNSEGPDFTRSGAGFELLPGQFGPN